jgi:cellobiose phosphorylase
MTAGRDAPTPGEAKNAWLTGTAAWSFVAASQHILGVRPTPDGLVIDPCIPHTWKGFRVQRKYRGKTYNIEVTNPHGVCRGVRRMTVNGAEVAGNLIPLGHDDGAVVVTVELG